MQIQFLSALILLGSVHVDAWAGEYRQNDSRATGYRDTDVDGIADFRDLCPRTALGAAVDAHGCQTLTSAVLGAPMREQSDCADESLERLPGLLFRTPAFAQNSAMPGAETVDQTTGLFRLAAGLGHVVAVEVVGHADVRGDASYNQILSERRAKAVGEILLGSGLESSRLRMRGAGESEARGGRPDSWSRHVVIELSFVPCKAMRRVDLKGGEG